LSKAPESYRPPDEDFLERVKTEPQKE